MTVAGGCEGDINRQNANVPGSSDGRIDGDDITWYDLFANGIRCPQVSPNEFQRMDVAPLADKGDGGLGADRNGLENLIAAGTKTQAGGQTAPNGILCSEAARGDEDRRLRPSRSDAVRSFAIASVTSDAGGMIEVPLVAELAGDEVISQFTLHFDPLRLSIDRVGGTNANPDVVIGDEMPEGTRVTVNTTQISKGDIGIVVNFNGASDYPARTATAGRKKLLTLRFDVMKWSGGVSPVSFSDSVFVTRSSDRLGRTLPISGGLIGGSVVIRGDFRSKSPSSLRLFNDDNDLLRDLFKGIYYPPVTF